MSDNKGELIIYQTEDGLTKIDVRMENETVWLTRKQMADLFDRDISVIGRHVRNVFDEGELSEESNVQKMHIANSDKLVKIYNLDMIIAVGYRVNSKKATNFRIWATKILKEMGIETTGSFRSVFLEGPPNRGENSVDYITQIAVPIEG